MAGLSEIEIYVIDRVRERRHELDISQHELSVLLGKSDGYISHFESPKTGRAYNVEMLNELAKVLKCSPRDFWPDKPL